MKRADLQLVTRATTAGKSGPTAGERADPQLVKRVVPTTGKEEHSQQQATSTKRAGDEDAGVRSRRRCPRQSLKVHQLQLIDKTIRIPVQAQRQLPTIHKITKTVKIPQAQFVLQCYTEVLEIRSSRRPWSSHRSSTQRVSSTQWLICPLWREIMSPRSRQRRTPLRPRRPITLTGPRMCQS